MDRAYGWGVLPSIDGYFIMLCVMIAYESQLEILHHSLKKIKLGSKSRFL